MFELVLEALDWRQIAESWNTDRNYQWWLSILIGLLYLVFNGVISVAMMYVREANVIEYGYPSSKSKQLKKKLSKYSFFDRIFLLRLVLNAERFGIFLLLKLICHWLNLLSLLSTIVGFIGMIIFPGSGWAVTLALYPCWTVLIVTQVIEFIPDIISLRSIRDRYRLS